tara:strand:- start:120 stop:593 length:474 start_codon:yes stop_codon:yes gene_type:complete
MAGERHVDLAVVKLQAFLNSNLPAKLRAVESAQSLSTNALTDPVAVIAHRAPFDNRSPLVEVFDQSWDFVHQRENLIAVDCTVALNFISDANLAGAEQFMRRYVTALIDTIQSDTTLGSSVVTTILRDGSSDVGRGADSTTRYVYTQGVEVHVHAGA